MYSKLRATLLVLLALCLLSTATVLSQEKVKISIMHIWDGTRIPLINEVIRRFEEQHPHIEVESILVAATERKDKVSVSLAAGTAPDVIMALYHEAAEWADMGGVWPLDGFLQSAGIELSDHLYDSLVPFTQLHGETIFIPQMGGPVKYLLYYNTTHYAEAGLDPSRGPADWDELEQNARKLTERDPSGEIFRLGFDVIPSTDSFQDWLVLNGGEPALWPVDGQFTFHGKTGQDTLRWMLELTETLCWNYPNLQAFQSKQRGFENGFITGLASMLTSGVWVIQQAEARGFSDYAIALRPPAPGHEPRYLSESGWGYFIPSTTQHPEAAWEFLQFFTLEMEGAGYFLQAQARPSSVREINLDPIYFDLNPFWPVIMEGFNQSIPFTPELPKVSDVPLDVAIKSVFRRENTIEEALSEAARLMQVEFEQSKRY